MYGCVYVCVCMCVCTVDTVEPALIDIMQVQTSESVIFL